LGLAVVVVVVVGLFLVGWDLCSPMLSATQWVVGISWLEMSWSRCSWPMSTEVNMKLSGSKLLFGSNSSDLVAFQRNSTDCSAVLEKPGNATYMNIMDVDACHCHKMNAVVVRMLILPRLAFKHGQWQPPEYRPQALLKLKFDEYLGSIPRRCMSMIGVRGQKSMERRNQSDHETRPASASGASCILRVA
jgi:hypothetical protein